MDELEKGLECLWKKYAEIKVDSINQTFPTEGLYDCLKCNGLPDSCPNYLINQDYSKINGDYR